MTVGVVEAEKRHWTTLRFGAARGLLLTLIIGPIFAKMICHVPLCDTGTLGRRHL